MFPKGENEIKFYQMIFNENCDNQVAFDLRKFIPQFKGLFSCLDPSSESSFIAIKMYISTIP